MTKKKRRKTRRQREIRFKEQLRRQAAQARAEGLACTPRSAHRKAEQAERAARTRKLTRLLALSFVVMLYGVAIWSLWIMWPDVLYKHWALFNGLLIGLGASVIVCLVFGLVLTIRDKAWNWVGLVAFPVTTVPALYAYCSRRRKAIIDGPPSGRGRSTGRVPQDASNDSRLLGD